MIPKSDSSRRVVPNAVASVLQIALVALALFLIYRFLLQRVGTEKLGTWSLVVALVSLGRVAELGIPGSVVRYVARLEADHDYAQAERLIARSAALLAVSLGLGLLALYVPLRGSIDLLFPRTAHDDALQLLPWCMAMTWVSGISGVLLAGLDGQSRMTQRAALVIAGTLLLTAAAMALVPGFGIRGMVLAQLGQGLFLMIGAALVLSHRRRPPAPARRGGERVRWKALLGYGAGFQFITLVGILLDPMTKAILGRVDGLSAVAYFELASKLVLQVRNLVVSANQVMVPYIASITGVPGKVAQVYRSSWKAVFVIAIPVFALLAVNVPAISMLWLGTLQPLFCAFALLLIGANAVNVLCGPAYFSNLGEGELRWNVLAHAIMAAANALLSVSLGYLFQATGVILGYSLAVISGSVMLLAAFHVRSHIRLRSVVGREDVRLLAVSLLGVGAGLLGQLSLMQHASAFLSAALITLCLAVLLIPWLSSHSGVALMAAHIKRLRI